jgi:glycosyltransferase involved in cell wall biosynthesis
MRRLVQVLAYYSPPSVGGMEMRARDRADWLASQGWAVETLTSSEQTHPHTVTDGNLIVRYLRSLELAHTPLIFSLPAALLRVPRDSAVHVDTSVAYVPEVTALMCRLRRMPYLVRMALDSAGHSRLRSALLLTYQRAVLGPVYRGAALVVVLTSDDIAFLAEKYRVDPQRIRVIPNASTFTLVPSARSAPHRPFRLLFVGRVARQKNVPLLLRSLRHFIDTYSLPIHLDLAGDGEDMPDVRRLIRELDLTDQVSLPGFVTGEQLEQLYEQSDALVLTSTREAFGQVMLEAMTKALPVIASDIRCVRAIVADGTSGLLADLDAVSFAQAIHRLVTEEGLYAKLSLGALESAQQYSMEATGRAYEQVYAELRPDLAGQRGA